MLRIIACPTDKSRAMKNVAVNFGKSYDEQSKEARERFTPGDFMEIKNLLAFKERVKTRIGG